MLRAQEAMPLNMCLMGKGQAAVDQGAGKLDAWLSRSKLSVGAFKIHEDWGTDRNAIRIVGVADEYDVQVAIHTDTLNE